MRVFLFCFVTACAAAIPMLVVSAQESDPAALQEQVRQLEAKVKELKGQLEGATLRAEEAEQSFQKATARIGLLEAYIAQNNLPVPALDAKPPLDAELLKRCNAKWEGAGYKKYQDFWIKVTKMEPGPLRRGQHFTQEYEIAGSIAYIGSDREVTGVVLAIEFLEDQQVLGSALVNARISDDPMSSRVFDCLIVVETPTDPCQTCATKGNFPCTWCEGKAKVDCSACQGKGRLPSGKRCPTCNGSGSIKCGRCKGTGNVDCLTCSGSGRVERPSRSPSRRITTREMLKDKPK